jgi:hypothetical protein
MDFQPVYLQTPPDPLNSLIILLTRYVVSLYKGSGGVWSFAPDTSNPDSKYKCLSTGSKQARHAKSSRVAGASKKNVIQFRVESLVRTKKNALANPSPSKTALKTSKSFSRSICIWRGVWWEPPDPLYKKKKYPQLAGISCGLCRYKLQSNPCRARAQYYLAIIIT